jgi:choice-of-anchor A domain-containing protein
MKITALIVATMPLTLLRAANAKDNYCGASWEGAGDCHKSCPGGVDSECPSGESCFGGVTCSVVTAATDSTCPYSANLGDGFSAATDYTEKFPNIRSPVNGMPIGRDDSVAVFVGGNYYGKLGAEIEGKIVTLGDFRNDDINSFVQVGLGSQIIPNNGEKVIIVGGDIEMNIDVVVMQNNEDIYGDIVYRGTQSGSGAITSNGDITQDPNLDLSMYEKALTEIRVKSEYWSTLTVNGEYTPYYNGPNGNTAVFEAGNDDCLQVFHLSNDEFSTLPWGINVKFDQSLDGKTVLINIAADSQGTATVQNLANFFDPYGNGHFEFDSDFTANVMWNFYDANHVDLGAGADGNGEFQGTLLVPNGSLTMNFAGHSGRVIVGGDLTQDKAGNELHSYEYDPVCPLPLPPCVEATPSPTTKNPTAEPAPTSSPSKAPSMAPTPTIEILENECPDDIQLLAVNGITEYGDVPPIHILAQDQYTVTFQVHQNWFAGSVSYMYTQYPAVPNGETCCLANANVTQSDTLTFTAECMHMAPVSIIDLWVVDAALDADLDTAEIPECCHSPEDAVLPTVQYTFQLHCVPQCVPTSAPTEAPVIASRARNLRGKDLSL